MFGPKNVAMLALVVFVSATRLEDLYSKQEVKDMKIVFCGNCKDATVRKDLLAYAECAGKLFPEQLRQVMAIRTKFADKPDECFDRIKKGIVEFAGINPVGTQKIHDCFKKHVNRRHLAKCK